MGCSAPWPQGLRVLVLVRVAAGSWLERAAAERSGVPTRMGWGTVWGPGPSVEGKTGSGVGGMGNWRRVLSAGRSYRLGGPAPDSR